MCPFLAMALLKGVPQVPVISDGKVPPGITCCREDCQWWHGGKCAMQSITDRLDQFAKYLGRPEPDAETA